MAQEFEAIRSQTLKIGGLSIGPVSQTKIGDAVQGFKKLIPANSANARVTLPVDVSTVKAAGIVANQDCTIKTNSTSTPTDTLALQANAAILWQTGDPTALFLTADVTDFYITTGGTATLVQFAACTDSTPVLTE